MRATLAAVAAGTVPAATGLHLVDANIKAVATDLARLASAPDASAAIVRAAQQATRIQQHVAGLREGESRVGPREAVAAALAPRVPEVAALQSRLQAIGSGTVPLPPVSGPLPPRGGPWSASMTALVASLAAPPPALVRASQSVGAMATRLEHLARASRAPTQGMVAFREEVGRSAQVLQRQALALDAVAAAMTKSSRNASLSSYRQGPVRCGGPHGDRRCQAGTGADRSGRDQGPGRRPGSGSHPGRGPVDCHPGHRSDGEHRGWSPRRRACGPRHHDRRPAGR
jgi:hypothetical protein